MLPKAFLPHHTTLGPNQPKLQHTPSQSLTPAPAVILTSQAPKLSKASLQNAEYSNLLPNEPSSLYLKNQRKLARNAKQQELTMNPTDSTEVPDLTVSCKSNWIKAACAAGFPVPHSNFPKVLGFILYKFP